MARTTVNVDPVLLDEARRALGTDGLTETVNAALAVVARRARLDEFDVREFQTTEKAIRESRRDRLARG